MKKASFFGLLPGAAFQTESGDMLARIILVRSSPGLLCNGIHEEARLKRRPIFALLILALLSLNTFAQWTDTPKKDIVYSNLVYYSPGGTIFHKDSCKLKSGGTITVRDAISNGLKPCSDCFPEAYPQSYVWKFSLESPAKTNALGYSDGQIDISFVISKTQIGFVIKNNSSKGAKINWDELRPVRLLFE